MVWGQGTMKLVISPSLSYTGYASLMSLKTSSVMDKFRPRPASAGMKQTDGTLGM